MLNAITKALPGFVQDGDSVHLKALAEGTVPGVVFLEGDIRKGYLSLEDFAADNAGSSSSSDSSLEIV